MLDEEDSCVGDSGGPLVAPKSLTDNSAVVFGILSHSHDGPIHNKIRKCANGPAVFTRVTHFLGWIRSYMKGKQ